MRAAALLATTIIVTNITSVPGEIGANFFDALNESQVWINVEPKNLDGGRNPILLNATLSFPGRNLAGAPESVDLRAQAYCYEFLTRIRQPVLTLTIDGAVWRFDTPERPIHVSASCGNGLGSSDVIIARITFDEFRAISTAREVIVDALGFHTQLAPSDLQALAMFAQTVGAGVTVR
jgi:hypothetical protein